MEREIIISDLQDISEILINNGYGGWAVRIAEALSLLKEQEEVKPKSKVRHGANAQIQHFCGNCNSMLHGKPKYCSECGKGVLW